MKSSAFRPGILVLLALLLAASFVHAISDQFRIWKNTEGKSIEARLVERKADGVVLEMRNAKRYEVPLAKLSKDDVTWMDAQESDAKEADMATAGIAFETLMTKPGNVIFEDDLAEIREGWSAGNGEWIAADGALLGKELAADNHGATFKRTLTLKDAVIQYSFKLAGANSTTLSIDNGTGHLCRVSITPAGFTAQKDDNDKDTGPDEAARYNTVEMDLADDEWHTLLIEIMGDTFLAQIDGEEKEVSFGSHEMFAGEKSKLGFTISGESVQFKDLKIWEALPNEEWEAARKRLERRMN